ncbi:MAG: porin family protein [Saprospiraceae bacterium]|nr:PorT family protein [Saprospiraceae bacterium]
MIKFTTQLIAIISTSLYVSHAQINRIFVGANAGIQATSILNKNDLDEGGQLDYSTPYKFQFGIDLGYIVTKRFAFQTGAIYSQQGQNYVTNGNALADFKTELNYIKIPLLANWTINPDRKCNFGLQFGFQFSILNSAKSSRSKINSNQAPFGYYSSNLFAVDDFYSSVNLDFVVGPSVSYKLNDRMRLGGVLRLDYSLSDIEKKESKPSIRDISNNVTICLPQLFFHYIFSK